MMNERSDSSSVLKNRLNETEMNTHSNYLLVALFFTILAVTSHAVKCEEPNHSIETAAIKSAIEKSLPYIEEKGRWWMEKKECMSCHRNSFMAWSHIEASYAGIKVDANKVNSWIDWCDDDLFELVAEKDRKYEGEMSIARNLSGGAQMLALSTNWKSTETQKSKHKKIIDMLLKGQQKNGSWAPGGQLPMQKRELAEITQVITIWNALALRNISETKHVDSALVDGAIKSASKFVSEYVSGKSSEWLAIRALFAHELSDDSNSTKYQRLVFEAQNEDGGWGWIAGEESDILATAQVLYAMLEMNVPANDARLQKAIQLILSKQQKNGSWKVNGTKTKAKSRVTETANYWGACWAVIALSKSLSQSLSQNKR